MSSPAKSRRQTAMDGSGEKLNSPEVSALVGLLHRAVKHGQVQTVMDAYRDSRASVSTHVPCAALLNSIQSAAMTVEASGSMSDAAKRQRDVDEGSEWDRVSSVSHDFVTKYDNAVEFAAPYPREHVMPVSGKTQEKLFELVNPNIPVPEKMTVFEWGRVVCVMDKVKDKNMCYSEMVEDSKNNSDMHRYLSKIVKTYGTCGTGKPKGKISPAVDLAMYLEAICWESQAPANDATFIRQLK